MSAAAFLQLFRLVILLIIFYSSHKNQRYLLPGEQELDVMLIGLIHLSEITKVSLTLG
jgi:hypothetical protein